MKVLTDRDPALTVRQVATQLAISEASVCALLNRDELCGFRVGRRWRVRPEDLRAFIEARQRPVVTPPLTRSRKKDPASEWGDLDPIDNVFA